MITDKGIYADYFSSGQFNKLRYNWYKEKFFSDVKEKRILEIGCGDGGVINLLRENNKVYGLDISKTGIDYLKKIGLSCKLYDASEDKIPFEDNFFDYVIILETFEHLKNIQNCVEEIQRVLKVGGEMICSIPNPNNQHRLIYPALFTQGNFFDYLRNNKFEIVKDTTYGFIPPFWWLFNDMIGNINHKQKQKKGNKTQGSTPFSRLSRTLSNSFFNAIKPKIFGLSFVYQCINTNPTGAKEMYKLIADESKEAYK